MSLTGIRSRRIKPLPPEIAIDPSIIESLSGILPRGVKERAIADDSDLSPEQPTADQPIVPADIAAPSPSRRTSESPSMPATSLSDEDALKSAVRTRIATRPRRADEPGSLKAKQDEYSTLANNPVHDTNGRFKSALWNFVREMSQQAQRVSASGRPVDEYGLASVVGAGIGGAAAGGINPRIDDENKRRMRMASLEEEIGRQLEIERSQAAINKTNAEAEYTRGIKPRLEEERAANARARAMKPDKFSVAGKMFERVWDEDAGEWQTREIIPQGSEGPLVDTSKVPNAEGLLPRDVQRKQLAEANNKFKAAESQKDRDFKAGENEKDRGIKRAQLREQIRAHLEAEKQRRTGLGQAAQRVRISLANAKIQAERFGVPLNDYIDSLTDNDVEVYQDK